MTPKQTFFAQAKAAGVEVDYQAADVSSYATLDLHAPHGRIFAASGCHTDCSIDALTSTRGIDWANATRQLNAILALGFVDCPDRPHCDHCDQCESGGSSNSEEGKP